MHFDDADKTYKTYSDRRCALYVDERFQSPSIVHSTMVATVSAADTPGTPSAESRPSESERADCDEDSGSIRWRFAEAAERIEAVAHAFAVAAN